MHGFNRPASSGKIKSANDHFTLSCHSSFISISFQMHLDLIGLLHGLIHVHVSLCLTLPNFEGNSSVQITLPNAINTRPLSSFQTHLARQLFPPIETLTFQRKTWEFSTWKLSLNLTVWRFRNSRIQSFVPLPNTCWPNMKEATWDHTNPRCILGPGF